MREAVKSYIDQCLRYRNPLRFGYFEALGWWIASLIFGALIWFGLISGLHLSHVAFLGSYLGWVVFVSVPFIAAQIGRLQFLGFTKSVAEMFVLGCDLIFLILMIVDLCLVFQHRFDVDDWQWLVNFPFGVLWLPFLLSLMHHQDNRKDETNA